MKCGGADGLTLYIKRTGLDGKRILRKRQRETARDRDPNADGIDWHYISEEYVLLQPLNLTRIVLYSRESMG